MSQSALRFSRLRPLWDPTLSRWIPGGVRCFREDRGDGGETFDLIERTVVKKNKHDPQQFGALTTRRDALSLYRAVLRASLLFVWRDGQGRVWRDVIRESSRKEFEAARTSTDAEETNRLLVVGRDALDKALENFMAARERIISDEEAQRRAGGQPPPPPP